MRVVAVSDLHGHLPDIQECELLIVAGDICPHFHSRFVGDVDDVFGQAEWLGTTFKQWLDNVPAKEVIAVFGNHDWVAEKKPHMVPNLRWHLLQDSTAAVLGLKVFGSPFQPHFYSWAFNAPPGEEGERFLAAKWAKIPDDTDVIIVHGPPAGYGDIAPDGRPTGSLSLTARIMEIKPILSVHGHIHIGRSVHKYSRGNAPDGIISNVSILDEAYRMVHKPIVFEIKQGEITCVSDIV